MNAEWMTQAEYARHRGVTRQAVGKLVAAGKIKLHNGKIDAAEADFALGESIERLNSPAVEAREAPGLTRARTVTEVYRARMAELQYERALGNLVATEGVADAASVCGETMVRIVRSLLTRADELNAAAAKDGLPGVRALLKSTAHEMLESVSAAFAKLASDATRGESASVTEVPEEAPEP
jgi:hypothetical protein